jgi:hypothetical protein
MRRYAAPRPLLLKSYNSLSEGRGRNEKTSNDGEKSDLEDRSTSYILHDGVIVLTISSPIVNKWV